MPLLLLNALLLDQFVIDSLRRDQILLKLLRHSLQISRDYFLLRRCLGEPLRLAIQLASEHSELGDDLIVGAADVAEILKAGFVVVVRGSEQHREGDATRGAHVQLHRHFLEPLLCFGQLDLGELN